MVMKMGLDRKKQFDNNIRTIDEGLAIYSYINANNKHMDTSILLREQFLMILSAFDTYLHGVVEDTIVSKAFDKVNPDVNDFDVSLSVVKQILLTPDDSIKTALLRNHVRMRLEKYSFQAPRSVEFALKHLDIKHGWQSIGRIIGMTPIDVRNTLSLCVRRRNKIAHESDWNPVTMTYDVISKQDVIACRDFIVKVIDAVDSII